VNRGLKKFLVLFFVVGLISIIAFKAFMYKIEYGFAKPQTEKHNINIPQNKPAILVFSKTTGFRHSESIKASKEAFPVIADRNNWFLYQTEDAGIFNADELLKFDVVIWNNSTGVCLTEEQRILFESFISNGGSYIGIHGSGDGSHHWDFYVDELLDAKFSHHPIKNHIQKATVELMSGADSILTYKLKEQWQHDEEWYIFFDLPPLDKFKILYQIDGTLIDPNGNKYFINQEQKFWNG